MIRYLRHAEIDKGWWDHRVMVSDTPLWYALSSVLDAAAPGWDALVDEDTGAVMPLVHRRKWGVRYLFQPFAVQRLGVFGTGGDAARLGAFLHAVPRHFRLWDIHLQDMDRTGCPPDVWLGERTNMELPLSPGLAELRAAYGESHRRGLRKWAEEGEVRPMGEMEFMTVMEQAPQLEQWGVTATQLATLDRLVRLGMASGHMALRGLWRSGSWLAVGSFVTWGGRTIFLKGLSTKAGRSVFALHRVMDAAIEEAVGTSAVMDMAGGHAHELRRFYAGFGARPTLYLHAKANRLPHFLRWYKQRSDGA